ncbi:MAG: TonB-dependent receptor [Bacteroidota bacterium]|nr:TonB-dependent receptor [Bacteroidota bacterium]
MKSLATLCLILLTTSFLHSGTSGKISGKVNDAQTGDALVGVNVVIVGTTLGASTDIDGGFVIINIPPGEYTVRASALGHASVLQTKVRVLIDQTTEADFKLSEEVVKGEEVIIVAQRPVVQKDVASSQANISESEIQKLPVTSVTAVIGLQAGIQGGTTIRGGASDQTAFMLDGLTLRDERNNTPITGISLSAVQDIQVQTGGFNAEYGNIRSGIVNVITKEGSPNQYTVSITGRYSPPTAKNFGGNIFDKNSYWIRPYLDPAVAFVGTTNGSWDYFTQQQYQAFEGWNSISEKTMKDPNPAKHLTPLAAQQLFLFQHRKSADIIQPDYDVDMGIGGPVIPMIGDQFGNLRFFASYRSARTMYMIPLATNDYRDYTGQLKVTADITGGMKIMFQGLQGQQYGTTNSRTGLPGFFTSPGSIASEITGGGSFADSRMYSDAYWSPSKVNTNSYGTKFTHILSSVTSYEISINRVVSQYQTNPGRNRNTDSIYYFGNGYKTDEGPFGYTFNPTTGVNGLRMSIGFSNSRDSSKVAASTVRFDFNSQMDKYDQIKAGVEFTYTKNDVNYASIDPYLPRSGVWSKWSTTPIRGALYLQDKIEYEGMIANIGIRMDYSDPRGTWFEYSPYDKALSAEFAAGLDTILARVEIEKSITFSPRIGIAFPVTEYSKLFFNYGHFRQMPTPENLYLIRRSTFDQSVTRLANPNNPLPKTVSYELGYEHSLFEQYLVRIAGYYKDITDQPALITFVSRDTKVNYSVSTPNSYADIRGFEITLQKNRGEWITGFLNYTYMASSSGRYGFGFVYENAADQRTYERDNRETDLYQSKPVPSPYARFSLDLFTPIDYDPMGSNGFLFYDWRLNFTGSWQNGNYFTWAGGGGASIPGIRNNMQYKDNYFLDMRVSKSFKILGAELLLFMDIFNLPNIQNFSGYGFIGTNFDEYMKSLHMPSDKYDSRFGYVNITGDDQPGDVRKDGVDYVPIVAVGSTAGVTTPFTTAIYYDASSQQYLEYKDNAWVQVDQGRLSKALDDKAYIRMPSMPQFLFLNPRDMYFGMKLTIDF